MRRIATYYALANAAALGASFVFGGLSAASSCFGWELVVLGIICAIFAIVEAD